MGRHYELTVTLEIEHTWDKGPRPSGYAQIKGRLKTKEKGDKLIIIPLHKFWDVKAPSYISLEEKKTYEEQMERTYIPMAVSGMQDGASSVFAEVLDFPIENTAIYIERITIDLVFSTRKSFEFAVREALTSLIEYANDKGYLRLTGN